MSSTPEPYDLLVLGSGEGGKYLAWTEAKQGKKVAVIERAWIGGSCPNIACLPSKNVIHSAKVASYVSRSGEFGISTGNIRIDMSVVRERKRAMVAGLVDLHVQQYRTSGAELIMGSGRLVGPTTLAVTVPDGGTRTLRGDNLVINTGSRATIDAIPGLPEAQPLTHIEALELDQIPGHLIIIGGGPIGLEFAQAMRRFGSRVTIIERNARLVHREDPDVTDAVHALFADDGIDVLTDAHIVGVDGVSGDHISVQFTRSGVPATVTGTHLLVASGRTPNTHGIGLVEAGVQLTTRGHVLVNERLQATAPGVWAIGDCAGNPHFTHVSFDDFRVVRDNLAGLKRVITGRQVPYCLFTDPELARLGLSETEATEAKIPYRLAKIPMKADLRTRTLSETRGFMKALIATDSDRILGFAMFGVMAGEVMATVQVAMLGGLPYTVLHDAVFTHPTMPEGLIALLSTVPRRSS
jgi:pyruvate/2-oxoglutarate dehydrogenase complex dihydrolipoamide dehydrogenase (E3) component